MDGEKARYLEELYRNEMHHMHIYGKFAETEKHKDLKEILQTLATMEAKHAKWWAEILEINNIKPVARGTQRVVPFYIFLRRIFGLGLTIKIIENMELGLEDKFRKILTSADLAPREKAIIKRIDDDESKNERALEEKVAGYGRVISNVRDIVFGMNDGMVELLAVVVGLAAALTNPVLVLLGGFIVSVSGTLSMAGGAYLSTEYEISVVEKKKRIGVTTPLRSAVYVGVMYFIGTLFPLSPFIFGLTGYVAIAVAIIVTAIILTIAATMIAVLSDTSVSKRILKTLLISLGIAAITIIIGMYARSILHLPSSV
jgi:vacuolar iron transporter family protein